MSSELRLAGEVRIGKGKYKELTTAERQGIVYFLLCRREGGKLKKNAVNDAAAQFGVSRQTVSRLWKRARESLEQGNYEVDVSSRKPGRSGRKRKDWSKTMEKVKDVPQGQRDSLRNLSKAISVPRSTLHRMMRDGQYITRRSPKRSNSGGTIEFKPGKIR